MIEFIQESLEHPSSSFTLISPTGHKFEKSDNESTLFQLKLVPATILTFHWNSNVPEEIANSFLKPEVMMLVQSL